MSKKKDKRERAAARRPRQGGEVYVVHCDIRRYYNAQELAALTAAKAAMCKEQRKKVYISGAIAHYDLKERMAAFGKAEKELAAQGYVPVNPFKNGLPQTADWREHMRRDIGLLLDCDGIYMLKGWELSKGAKLELDVASTCGIKVMFE